MPCRSLPLVLLALTSACSTPEAKPTQPPPAATNPASAAPAETTPAPSATAPRPQDAATEAPAPPPSPHAAEKIADPASSHCLKQGGRVEMVSTDAGERAVCVFGDGSRCEAWRFKRGECSQGACRDASGVCAWSKP